MCGIAGLHRSGPLQAGDAERVARMLGALTHRGPDARAVRAAGRSVLGSARLAIVDVAHGQQPFANEDGSVQVVYNGEIYNHVALRRDLLARGHRLHTRSDGEVIAHLYEEFGEEALQRLDGQFAIALVDRRRHQLLLARDALGICPLHWTEQAGVLAFASEIKGLAAGLALALRPEPDALLQMAYFGTVCAPLSAFAGIQQLEPATWMRVDDDGRRVSRRWWQLQFPTQSDQPDISESEAADGLAAHLERAIATHVQGDFAPTCFLSGGIDSAVIAALLARHTPQRISAFSACSDDPRLDEGEQARRTAAALGLDWHPVPIDSASIAQNFPRLVWHGEVPLISTESSALMRLAAQARGHSKIVLTGEGADEAFGGYLAFRQAHWLGPLTAGPMAPLRALVRRWLQHHYGTDCLLPADQRLGALRQQFGCVPAQAGEWEFYRDALGPLLAEPHRQRLARDEAWAALRPDTAAVRGRHPLHQSLYTAYQVMLPNYLLGAHGDRVFAAESVEGRYPFLDRQLVEFSARLPPRLKLRGWHNKLVLRQAAARWLPDEVVNRPKRRFAMPFGTPFVGPQAPQLYAHLLSPQCLRDYGHFDPQRVSRLLAGLPQLGRSGSRARRHLDRLAGGLAINLVTSVQLWHHLFVQRQHELLSARDWPTPTEPEERHAAWA